MATIDQDGNPVHKAVGLISAQDAFAALTGLVDAVQEAVVIHAQESTKQAQIAAYRDTELKRIAAAEQLLDKYFTQVFAERSETFTALLGRLDTAMEAGDAQVAATVLGAIVEVAKSSPLAALGDLSAVRAAFDDPDHVWEL